MILHGNQRGGAKNLALHLLKTENEHVEIHELRGFVSNNLVSALNEIHAVSRGTKARQFLFSLSLNPPPSENVPTAAFEDAIRRIENKLGLSDQPRAIVFHEKKGRRHAHCVWSRIDMQAMKAIPLPFSKRKLMDVSRELYREHGWTMPRGLMQEGRFDQKNFTLAQWQQARRIGKNPKAIKQVFQDCWAVSDSQTAFQAALKDYGYTLARGDRRGFVALDHRCEVFSVPKWVGIKTKEARSKLIDQDALPSVDEARAQISTAMAERLDDLQNQQNSTIKARLADIEERCVQMVRKHKSARKDLCSRQEERWQAETLRRQARFQKGLRGFLDRLTGRRRHIREQNEREMLEALHRDQLERDTLIFRQLEERRTLQARLNRLQTFNARSAQSLFRDREIYRDIRKQRRDIFETPGRSPRKRPRPGPGRER